MNLTETLLINAILVTFPLLVHEYFVIHMQNKKKEKIEILLSIALFLSLYLTMYYKQYIPTNYQFTSIILPVIVSYLVGKPKLSILISIIEIEYILRELNYNLFSLITFFILLYIIYIRYTKTNKNSSFLINNFIILSCLTLIINEFPFKTTELINIIIVIILFAVITILIKKALEISKEIINLHSNLKEFEKEKDIKISLFKITHEIKNPIAVIKGYLSMFNINNKEKSEKYVSIMKDEIDRTLNLLNDFMEFSKIKVETSLTNINQLIDEIKEILIPFFNSNNVSFFFEVEENITTSIDSKRMKQVIINIIKNAVEACDISGCVSTTVFTDESSLFIYVKDNGIGMSKEILDNILTPFYTTKEKGTGLGVSLSKEIIEAHQGTLNYSSSVGHGTLCKITIPLKKL